MPKPPAGDIRSLAASWATSLEAERKSPKTVKTYTEATRLLADHLAHTDGPQRVADIGRADLDRFFVALHARCKPATVNNRYRGLQQFWRWLLDEGEVDVNPFDRMRPPQVPDSPLGILTAVELKALVRTCEARSFADLRDEAIIRVFFDTGLRSEALILLHAADVDLRTRTAWATEKYERPKELAFTARTAVALDRYLRARQRHTYMTNPYLWLGVRGRFTDSGVRQMLERRSARAGIRHVHPHMFRGTKAVRHLLAGGSETGLMRTMGWQSPQMIARYTAAVADILAMEEQRRLAIADEF